MLRHVAHLNKLTHVDIGSTAITDEGLRILHELSQLRCVSLAGAEITGTGMDYLPPNVEELYLSDTYCDDDALRRIPSLTKLQRLSLSGTRITDAGIVELSKLNELQHLSISHTAISERGINVLGVLPRLEDVDLTGCAAVPLEVRRLCGAKMLRSLGILAK